MQCYHVLRLATNRAVQINPSSNAKPSTPSVRGAFWCLLVAVSFSCDKKEEAKKEDSKGSPTRPGRDTEKGPPPPEAVQYLGNVYDELDKREALDALAASKSSNKSSSAVPTDLVVERIAPPKNLSAAPTEELLDAYNKAREELGIAKMIYLPDDREEIADAQGQEVGNAQATVALVQRWALEADGAEFDLRARSFGKQKNLCKEERFYEQPAASFCSGVLVAADKIATAGHCVSEDELPDIRFVFGYLLQGESPRLRYTKDDVYSGKQIIAGEYDEQGPDWAVIELDRAVVGRAPVAPPSKDAAKREEVYVIGHPSGLPAKIARGSEVRENTHPAFFLANLDTYGGNSGSPVFSADSHLLVGLLVRGDTDFRYDKTRRCNVSYTCPSTGCRGEDVVKLSVFRDAVWGPK